MQQLEKKTGTNIGSDTCPRFSANSDAYYHSIGFLANAFRDTTLRVELLNDDKLINNFTELYQCLTGDHIDVHTHPFIHVAQNKLPINEHRFKFKTAKQIPTFLKTRLQPSTANKSTHIVNCKNVYWEMIQNGYRLGKQNFDRIAKTIPADKKAVFDRGFNSY